MSIAQFMRHRLSGPQFDDTTPGIPRRLFLAAGLAALAGGGAVALGLWGQITAPGSESFRFARGTSFASGENDRLRAYLAQAAADDRIVAVILGHSGSTGDAEANMALSLERANAARDIALDLGVDAERLRVSAMGGAAPLPQEAGESDRAHQARLARVEVILQVRQ